MRLAPYCWLTLVFILPACQHKPAAPSGPPSPEVKIGKPYVVEGTTYYPEYDPTYDKIGDASWYGPGFDGNRTASGEAFNQDDLTAAHPTLPMPSLVRVTNLKNGRSLIVRINDRGPFHSKRIIDLSKKSAERLGIKVTTPVRVQFLKPETEAYIASLRAAKPQDMVEVNNHVEDAKDAAIVASTEPPAQAESGDSAQIVESTTTVTHAGAAGGDAAPLLSVTADDLASPLPENQHGVSVNNKGGQAAKVIAVRSLPSTIHIVTKPAAGDAAVVRTSAFADEPGAPAPAPKNQVGLGAGGHYYIQAGSFSSEDNAHRLAAKLTPIGNVATGRVEAGDKIWWRVRLGPFKEKQDADATLGNVRLAGVADARITHQ